MKKTNVTISFDEEKLTALRLYMEQKDLQLEDELTKAWRDSMANMSRPMCGNLLRCALANRQILRPG